MGVEFVSDLGDLHGGFWKGYGWEMNLGTGPFLLSFFVAPLCKLVNLSHQERNRNRVQ